MGCFRTSRIETGTGVGASGFTPVDFSYNRMTKDGPISIISYLVGSQFNERLDGVITSSSEGLMEMIQ